MSEPATREEFENLLGRVAALEAVCVILLRQLLRGDAVAIRNVAEGILRNVEELSIERPVRTEAHKGASDGFTKIARDLLRDL